MHRSPQHSHNPRLFLVDFAKCFTGFRLKLLPMLREKGVDFLNLAGRRESRLPFGGEHFEENPHE